MYKPRIYVYRFSRRRIGTSGDGMRGGLRFSSRFGLSVGLSRPPGTSVRRKNDPPLWILRLVKEDSNRSAERCRLRIWTRTRYEGSCHAFLLSRTRIDASLSTTIQRSNYPSFFCIPLRFALSPLLIFHTSAILAKIYNQ